MTFFDLTSLRGALALSFLFIGSVSQTTAQTVDAGRVVIDQITAIETDGGEDEPYFLAGDFCTGRSLQFEIERGQTLPLNVQIDIIGAVEFSVWDKDGSAYDCGKSGNDDRVGTVRIFLNQSTEEATIGGETVQMGERTLVQVFNEDARYQLRVRVETVSGDAVASFRPIVGCSAENTAICASFNGTCERARDRNGERHDLCRWTSAVERNQCATASLSRGLWTSRSSGFAERWISAVPGSLEGACISQMANIGGLPG